MRPVNPDTASRLRSYNDYASALMAPTSGTNTTFGGHLACAGSNRGKRPAWRTPQAVRPAITIAFSAGQKAAGQVCAFP
jgi:hypothetical protein